LRRLASERTIANGRRILFAITGLELGGAEVQLWHLCRALARRGWRPSVVSLIEPGIVGSWLSAQGIEVRGLGMRRGVASPLAVWRLAHAIDALEPALLHSHMFHANLLARAVCLMRPGLPLLNSSHVDERGVRLQHLAYRASARLCQRFHCVSRSALERLARSGAVARERLVYIPNGVPEPAAAPDARIRLRAQLGLGAGFVFLCAGRLHPAKDPANLLDAFARVAAVDPQARLLIAGTGPLESSLRAQIGVLGLGGAVQLLGARSDVPELLRAADGLVIPSRSEALPLVLLEAGLARLPVVSTAVGDVPALVEDGRSGLLCPAQDESALAARMLALARMDGAQRAGLAGALEGRVRAEHAFEQVAERFEQLYAELLAGR
jgi:glycosyltransferase involved in cell wall biosynthesis